MLFVRFGKITFALLALWLCFAAQPVQAQIDLVNTLADPTVSTDHVGGNLWQADAFETGNVPYTLASATLELSSTSGGVVTVDIYSNTGSNRPGAPLVTLGTSNPLAIMASDVVFTPLGVLTLQPNTVYWVVANSTTSADWGFTSSTAYSGVGFIPTASAVATSDDAGNSWATLPLSAGPDKYRIQVTGTPEPGVIALMAGLGSAGAWAFRRRRKA